MARFWAPPTPAFRNPSGVRSPCRSGLGPGPWKLIGAWCPGVGRGGRAGGRMVEGSDTSRTTGCPRDSPRRRLGWGRGRPTVQSLSLNPRVLQCALPPRSAPPPPAGSGAGVLSGGRSSSCPPVSFVQWPKGPSAMETWSLLCSLRTLLAPAVKIRHGGPSPMPMVLPTLGDSIHLCSSLRLTCAGWWSCLPGTPFLPSPCFSASPSEYQASVTSLPSPGCSLSPTCGESLHLSDGPRLGVGLPGGSVWPAQRPGAPPPMLAATLIVTLPLSEWHSEVVGLHEDT